MIATDHPPSCCKLTLRQPALEPYCQSLGQSHGVHMYMHGPLLVSVFKNAVQTENLPRLHRFMASRLWVSASLIESSTAAAFAYPLTLTSDSRQNRSTWTLMLYFVGSASIYSVRRSLESVHLQTVGLWLRWLTPCQSPSRSDIFQWERLITESVQQ